MSHCEDSFRFLTLGRLVIEKLNELSKLLFLRTIDRSFRSVLNMFYLAILLWGALKGTIILSKYQRSCLLQNLDKVNLFTPLRNPCFLSMRMCVSGVCWRDTRILLIRKQNKRVMTIGRRVKVTITGKKVVKYCGKGQNGVLYLGGLFKLEKRFLFQKTFGMFFSLYKVFRRALGNQNFRKIEKNW